MKVRAFEYQGKTILVHEYKFTDTPLAEFFGPDGTQLGHEAADDHCPENPRCGWQQGDTKRIGRARIYSIFRAGKWASMLHPEHEMSALRFINPYLEIEILAAFSLACDRSGAILRKSQAGRFEFVPPAGSTWFIASVRMRR